MRRICACHFFIPLIPANAGMSGEKKGYCS